MKEKSKPGDYTDIFIAIEGILTIGFKLSYRYLRENAGELKAQKNRIYIKGAILFMSGALTFFSEIYLINKSLMFFQSFLLAISQLLLQFRCFY